jgi:hypothetical protein
MHVAQEREWKAVRLEEGRVTERAVSTDREHHGAPLLQLGGDLNQAGKLGSSDPAEVVAVETQDDIAAAVFPQ